MDGMRDPGASWRERLSGDMPDADAVPGLAEWLDMEDWRAGWQPLPDPYAGIEQLAAIFQRVMRHGYAAYLRGERVMPDLFPSDGWFATMWQAGYANARMNAELEFPCSASSAERHQGVC
jgi:hypothetical protein